MYSAKNTRGGTPAAKVPLLHHLREVEGGIEWYLTHARAKLAGQPVSTDDKYDIVLTTIAQTEVAAYEKALRVVRKKIAEIRQGG